MAINIIEHDEGAVEVEFAVIQPETLYRCNALSGLFMLSYDDKGPRLIDFPACEVITVRPPYRFMPCRVTMEVFPGE